MKQVARRVAGGVLAFLLGALLVWWSLDLGRSGASGGAVDPAIQPERTATLQGRGTDSARPQKPIRPGQSRVAALTLVVVDDAAGKPVAGARIQVASAVQDLPAWAPPNRSMLLASGRTDAAGRWEVDPVALEAGGQIVFGVSHPSYRPASMPADATVREIEIRLEVGMQIQGSVEDLAGNPVPGAFVTARQMSLPDFAANAGAVTIAGSDCVTVEASSDGSFRLGVSPGRYVVEAFAVSWRPVGRPGWRAGGKPGGRAVLDAPAEEVRLRLEEVRVVCVLAVDASTDLPIHQEPFNVQVLGEDQVAATSTAIDWSLFDGAQWIRRPWPDVPGEARVLVVPVQRSPDGVVPEATQVLVDTPRYEPAFADVALQRVGAFAAAPSISEVRLRPKAPTQSGTVHVHWDRALPDDLWLPYGGPALIVQPTHGGLTIHAGSETRPGVWRFDRIPAGDLHLTVDDGVGLSETISRNLAPDSVLDISGHFPPVLGFLLDVLDSSGQPVVDADGHFRRVGSGHAMPFGPRLLDAHVDVDSRRQLLGFQRVAKPGEYRVVVRRAGQGEGRAQVVVSEGKFTRVRVVLEEVR